MAIYRYSTESINLISERTRAHHLAAFLISIGAICAVGFALYEIRTVLVLDAVFLSSMVLVFVRTRHRARQRVIDWLRSVEFEFDDEKATWRSKLGTGFVYRAECGEARFSERGIWLRSKSRRKAVRVPPELEHFDELRGFVEDWLPKDAIRRNARPPTIWGYVKYYGIVIIAAVLFYIAGTSRTRLIAIPACVLVGAGVAWYFAWCGRRIEERKWKILLPLSGYLLATALVGRAISLWIGK